MSDAISSFFLRWLEEKGLDINNKEFIQALELAIFSRQSFYLTGKAGSGKTTFLEQLKKLSVKEMVVVAPTGVAAIRAGGKTIHSFFQINPNKRYLPGDPILRTKASPESGNRNIYQEFSYGTQKRRVIQKLEILVIDEISMVRADILDLIDILLRTYRKKMDMPFGGVQVVLIGDPFQLPPIIKAEEEMLLRQHYESPFFFASYSYREANPIQIELKKIYRQKEEEFIQLLNKVRNKTATLSDLELLHASQTKYHEGLLEEGYILLATHNKEVQEVNEQKLASLDSKLKIFEPEIENNFPPSIYPFDPATLHIKVGAQVMFTRNNVDKGYFNGLIGKVLKIEKEGISIKTEKGEIQCRQEIWQNIDYVFNEEKQELEEIVLGEFRQYPLKLAWAITVHKSQGLTFDKVILSIHKSFAPGQVYVALSRCTSIEGVVLQNPIPTTAIRTDIDAIRFSQNLSTAQEVEATLEKERIKGSGSLALRFFRKRKFREAEELLEAMLTQDDISETPKFRQFARLYPRMMKNKNYRVKADLDRYIRNRMEA